MSNIIDTPMAMLKRFEDDFGTEDYLRHQANYSGLLERDKHDLQRRLDTAIKLRHMCTGYRLALEHNKKMMELAKKAEADVNQLIDKLGLDTDCTGIVMRVFMNIQAIQLKLRKMQGVQHE